MSRYLGHVRLVPRKHIPAHPLLTWRHLSSLFLFAALIVITHAAFAYSSSPSLSTFSYQPRIVHVAKRSLDVVSSSDPFDSRRLLISEDDPEASEDPPSYIPYYQLYDSIDSFAGRFFCLFLFILWMCFLFTGVGIVASDFFCPNLATLSGRLGLSEGVAGATLLALGNGSPDVFSTFSAFTANSASLAIGELLGAATFIVAVVTGSMAFIQPFQVPRHSFLRDVGFFTVAIALTLLILANHHITLWEASSMVIMYAFYVLYVAFSSWWLGRQQRRQDLLSKIRQEFEEETPPVPYRDHLEQDHIGPSSLGDHRPESSARSELSATSSHSTRSHVKDVPFLGEDEAEETFRLLADIGTPVTLKNEFLGEPTSTSLAISSSGHIIHPHSSSSRPVTRSQFRSSLLSAIEFRDVVNSLKDDSVARTLAVFSGPRNYHHHHHHQASGRLSNRPPLNHAISDAFQMQSNRARSRTISDISPTSSDPVRGHSRSLSDSERMESSDQPQFFLSAIDPPTGYFDRFSSQHNYNDGSIYKSGSIKAKDDSDAESSSGRDNASTSNRIEADLIDLGSDRSHPPKLRLDTSASSNEPNFNKNVTSKNSTVVKGDLPAIVVTSDNDQTIDPLNSEDDTDHISLKRAKYQTSTGSVFNVAKEVLRMLFPSLQQLKSKSIIGRIASIIAVPTLLGLTLTLPVVLEDNTDDCCDSDVEKDSADENDEEEGFARSSSRNSGSEVGREEYRLNRQHGFQIARKLHDQVSSPLSPSLEPISHTEDIERTNSMDTDASSDENGLKVEQILNFIQCTLAVPFILVASPGDSLRWWYIPIALAIGLAVASLSHCLLKKNEHTGSVFLCVVGFLVSAVWIMMLVNEVVGILLAVGRIFHISDAILGVTIFAVGNSMGDLISNITVARMGFPVMAFSACFAGPMLNILFGVGISGLYSILSRGGKSFEVEMNGTLFVSGIGLLVLLVSTLVVVPLQNYWMMRGWGLTLVAMYTIMMAINVTVEISQS